MNRILKGEIVRLCFSVPPQHYKSYTTLFFIALYLYKYPTHNVVYISYEQSFAQSQIRLAYRILKEHFKIIPISETQKEFLLPGGGSLITTSVNGTVTGRATNLIVIDDPIKGRLEAESKTYRNRVYDFFLSEVATRFRENITSIAIFMTRWHIDDLIGRLLKENIYEFKNIRVPAISDGLDDSGVPNNSEVGIPLLYTKEFYDKPRQMNKYIFQSMYQGLPIIKGDSVFKDVTYYSKLPDNIKYKIGSDFAYSESTKANYSVIVVFGYADNKHYLIEVIRYQKDVNYTINIVKNIYNKYKSKIGIEANGTQKATYDMLCKLIGGSYLYAIQPKGDKFTRALPFANEWNSGNILLPDPTVFNHLWLNDYLDELHNFTGQKDLYDDQVDASVNSFNMKSDVVYAIKMY